MDQISLQEDQKVITNTDKNETSEKNLQVTQNFDNFEDQRSHKNNSVGKSQHSMLSKILNKRISLNQKDEVQSLNDQERDNSEQMDIDQQNDIVNQLSFIENLNKNNIQDELMNQLSTKDRLIHANSKKYQGNQFFKEHNLEQAIQSYRIGLSLLNPEFFSSANESDYLLMAELTSNILYNMGTCYFILMSFRHAIKYYDQALLIKPNYLKAIHNRALCHFQQGNIFKAYQDIKAAMTIDRKNMNIQNDFLKIEDEYLKIDLSPENGNTNKISHSNEKNRLAKSIIQHKSPKSLVYPFSQTASSMINCEKLYSQKQTKSQQQIKPQQKDLASQTNDFKKENTKQQILRKKLQSHHRKKLFLNSLKFQKKAKSHKFERFQTKKQKKFRPYILNRSTNFFVKDQSKQDLDKKVKQTNNNCSKRRVKTENLEREQNFDNQRERQKYWGYLPIMVATGFGLYHSIRAVLGK